MQPKLHTFNVFFSESSVKAWKSSKWSKHVSLICRGRFCGVAVDTQHIIHMSFLMFVITSRQLSLNVNTW